jgi:hypothetical protein
LAGAVELLILTNFDEKQKWRESVKTRAIPDFILIFLCFRLVELRGLEPLAS